MPKKYVNRIFLTLILSLFLLIQSILEVPKEIEKTPDISAKSEIEASGSGSLVIIDDSSILIESSLVATAESLAATAESVPAKQTYEVISVTDGDTFKVNIDGKKEIVRLVGINTPETVDPRKPVECFGKQSSDKLKSLLIGQKVGLISDITQSDRDRYGRMLRFATVNGEDVGLIMIREGYAEESLYSSVPHFMYENYVQAQTSASYAKVGLWADEACVEGM